MAALTDKEFTSDHPCTDGWTRHDLADSPFFIYEKPRGRDRFGVYERGAGRRGTAREHGRARTLAAALELADGLKPSTPQEILSDVRVYDDRVRRKLDKLIALSRPGTRLWVLPRGDERGLGRAATSTGLALSSVEALFGENDLDCWAIRWRTDNGEEGQGLYAVTLEDARRAWWIVDDNGRVVAGGPPIFEAARASELAERFGGRAQLGLNTERVLERSA